jgi:hypothetical protein
VLAGLGARGVDVLIVNRLNHPIAAGPADRISWSCGGVFDRFLLRWLGCCGALLEVPARRAAAWKSKACALPRWR